MKHLKRLPELTIEELRKYDGMSNLSEEDAIEAIKTLHQLSLITYAIYQSNLKSV